MKLYNFENIGWVAAENVEQAKEEALREFKDFDISEVIDQVEEVPDSNLDTLRYYLDEDNYISFRDRINHSAEMKLPYVFAFDLNN